MIEIRYPQDFRKFMTNYPELLEGVHGSMRPDIAYRKIGANVGFRDVHGSEDLCEALNELANFIHDKYQQ